MRALLYRPKLHFHGTDRLNLLVNDQGFTGTGGAFRLTPDGSNRRALAVATVRNNQMVILDPAPSSIGTAGF